jgi:pyroglutamyl-peptidase
MTSTADHAQSDRRQHDRWQHDRWPTVLVTGFEPFGGAAHNPSGELARRLAELGHPDCHLVGDVLPVSFAHAPGLLAAAIDAHHPDIVLMLGLAENRHAITPERVALNLADASIADNDGAQPTDAPLEPHGPAARFTSLPAKQIAHAIADAGIAAEVSLSAGSYVCNAVMYAALGIAEQRAHAHGHGAEEQEGTRTGGTSLQAGFIHVPATPQLGGDPRFTLDELERGIRIAITTIVDQRS